MIRSPEKNAKCMMKCIMCKVLTCTTERNICLKNIFRYVDLVEQKFRI